MSVSLSALSRPYYGRGNIPITTTSQIVIDSYNCWALAASLLGHNPGGTEAGTREAGSIGICRGSSDATTGGGISAVGVAGTNRWNTSGAFPGAFTRGNNSTAHHWMLIEINGLEVLLNMAPTAGYLTFSVGKVGAFTGGSVSACPAGSATTTVQAAQTAYNATDGGQFAEFFGDTTVTGGTNYGHFLCSPTGDFIYLTSRVGTGKFRSFCAVWKTTGQQAGDTNNFFVLVNNAYSGTRGAPSMIAVNLCASLQPNNVQKSVGGVALPCVGSGSNQLVVGMGVDAISGKYKCSRLPVIETSPGYYERGVLPDLLAIGTAAIGGSYPHSGAQERIVAGDLLMPFPTVILLT